MKMIMVDIDLDSMLCHYKVYGPNKTAKKWVMDNVVYEFTVNCVWENGWWNWADNSKIIIAQYKIL